MLIFPEEIIVSLGEGWWLNAAEKLRVGSTLLVDSYALTVN